MCIRDRPYIDSCITFEELQALFDSRDIDLKSLPEGVLDNASYYGRIFARSGGLSDAVTQALKEQGLDQTFELKAIACDGIEACRMALLKASKKVLPANFIEGMACIDVYKRQGYPHLLWYRLRGYPLRHHHR